MLKDFMTEYRQKLCTPEEAVEVVKSGDWVDYTSSLGKPVLLDKALAKRRDELFDVKIRGNLVEGPIEVAECDETQEHFVYHTWHCSAYERKLCDRGLCYYIPMVFHNNAAYYKYFLNVNVVMVSVSPMDKHGYRSCRAYRAECGCCYRRSQRAYAKDTRRIWRMYSCVGGGLYRRGKA